MTINQLLVVGDDGRHYSGGDVAAFVVGDAQVWGRRRLLHSKVHTLVRSTWTIRSITIRSDKMTQHVVQDDPRILFVIGTGNILVEI